jgi:hypothetical protein
MSESFPRWPLLVSGLAAAISSGTCLALGIDLDWAVIGNTGFSGLLFGLVLLRQPVPSRPEPSEVDEEFVRRIEALAARMRQELEARRATAAR